MYQASKQTQSRWYTVMLLQLKCIGHAYSGWYFAMNEKVRVRKGQIPI